MVTKTLLEIVAADYRAAGGTGPVPRAFIDRWRATHTAYGAWPLWVRFGSGSAVAVRGKTRLDRATARTGNPTANVEQYRDEHDAEYYG